MPEAPETSRTSAEIGPPWARDRGPRSDGRPDHEPERGSEPLSTRVLRSSGGARAGGAAPDARLGALTGAVLCLAGSALLATQALPLAHKPPFALHAALSGATILMGLLLFALARRDRATLDHLLVADALAIAMVAVVVAESGGMRSVYAELYLFPIFHAAAFQPRRRLVAVVVLAIAAFLAPVAYGTHESRDFAAIAVICMPPVLLAAGVLSLVTASQRRQRAAIVAREAEARRLAENDALTGLGNYRMFWRRLDAEVARARRHGDSFSLVIMDLNGFKAINDEHGHQVGDRALCQVATALRGALREEDICCRQGGDEFAVIAVRAREEEAEELAERLTRAVSEIQVPGAPERRLGACVGRATFGRPATTADDLILRADEALREAKRRRRRAGPIAQARAAGQPPPAGRDVVGADERGRTPERSETVGGPSDSNGTEARDGSATRLVILSGYARALAAARDERAIAETTLAHLAGAVDATTAMILRGDGETEALRPLAAVGARDGAGVDCPVVRTATREKRSAVSAGRPTGTNGEGPGSELAVPILVDSEVWGCLLAASDRPGAYDDGARDLAEGMAVQMARALGWSQVLGGLAHADFGELYRLTGTAHVTAEECRRVIDLAWRVGRRLAFDPAALRSLYLAALFHDAGTVGVPAEVTGKPGVLSAGERAVVHEHPIVGERLLRPFPILREAAGIVRAEHERFDGAGYPDGLAGERIPLAARVLHGCQTWVAMTSPRPWRPALDDAEARAELARAAGTQLDPDVVRALLSELDASSADDPPAKAPAGG